MMQDLIVVKQLPVIEERLKTIKATIETRTKSALSLECSEETVKAIKKLRAELTRDFGELESQRKAVKAKVLEPYEAFEQIYRDCVTNVYSPADAELKKRIDGVELDLKRQKQAEVEAYFNEYAASRSLDFVSFEKSGIAVTLSSSMKSLKKQAKDFLDGVADDVAMIEYQEYSAEILVEYRKTLNATTAIMLVQNRHYEIEEAERQRSAAKQADVFNIAAESKVDAVLPPSETVVASRSQENVTKVYATTFTVRGTLEQLKELKKFLAEGEYDYEQQ